MPDSYYTWQTLETTLAGDAVRWAGKPGLEGWDDLPTGGLGLRASQRLMAQELAAQPGMSVLDLRCGAGALGAWAAMRGARVTLCDDHLVAVQAAQRTLALNGVGYNGVAGQVIHGEPCQGSEPWQGFFDVVLLDAPRGRAWVRHLLAAAARALRPGGRLLLAGPTRGGIKGYIEDAGEIIGPCQVAQIKAHHRLAVATAMDKPSPRLAGEGPGERSQFETSLLGHTFRVADRPGVFSNGELDPGTRALVEAMAVQPAVQPGEAVLDLGCGNGIVGVVAARLMGARVTCVDASAAALRAARDTLALNGVDALPVGLEVLASDCGAAVLDRRFDVVATNPPFHQGLGVAYDVARQFIRDAAAVLAPGGRLYLVANRFIPYERDLAGLFSRVRAAHQDNRFRVLEAIR